MQLQAPADAEVMSDGRPWHERWLSLDWPLLPPWFLEAAAHSPSVPAHVLHAAGHLNVILTKDCNGLNMGSMFIRR